MVMSSTPVQTSCSLSDIDGNSTTKEQKTPQRVLMELSDSEFAQFEEGDEEEEESDEADEQPALGSDVLPADNDFASTKKESRRQDEDKPPSKYPS